MFIKKIVLQLSLTLVAFVYVCTLLPAHEERITRFASDISIHADGSMTVNETITAYVMGQQIRYGLLREFPTRYKDAWGNNIVIGFRLVSASMDGATAPYRVEPVANGNRIYIGDPNRLVSHGQHNFAITYTTSRQLGFFLSHDELYWNVTGAGWRLPIDSAVATVRLPAYPDQFKDAVKYEAYTGYQGERGTAYEITVNSDNSITFKTTQTLRPYQGLTIVVVWPKGIVTPLTMQQKIAYFFQDNGNVLALVVIFLLFIFYCVYIYRKKRYVSRASTIIPLFKPPHDVSAGGVYYIKNMGFDNTSLVAELVDMARAGYFTIDSNDTLLSKRYSLKKRTEKSPAIAQTQAAALHYSLYERLFKKQETIVLGSKDVAVIEVVKTYLKVELAKQFEQSHVVFFRDYLFFGVVLLLFLAAYPALSLFAECAYASIFIFGVACTLVIAVCVRLFETYTPEGKRLADEIEGFKMYLQTAEAERMKLVGTPPERTPELYEKFLPYAIALGVEKQWAKQFVPLFDRMKAMGTPYHPRWFIGTNKVLFNPSVFSNDLRRGISRSIAASTKAPGTTSGSGGKGSSGGGGGGGGGGGW